jgi:hypothetical protein
MFERARGGQECPRERWRDKEIVVCSFRKHKINVFVWSRSADFKL